MSTKWSAFTAGSAISGTDTTVGLQSGANVKWTYNQAATFFWASPALVTPSLGVATATSINGNTFTAGSYTLTGTAGKTLNFTNILTLSGTDSTTMTFPATSATIARTDAANTFTGAQTFSSATVTAANLGTANTGTTASEFGDGSYHKTVLTVSSTLPAITGGAAQGVGKLLYTMPAGAIAIHSCKMSMSITQTQGHINADTPKVGVGSVIATGVVSDLTTPPTFQDILTGQTAANCTGTATVKTVSNQPMVMESGAAHTVHFNAAATWAASGDAAAAIAGTVTLIWSFIG